jgi:hypothetical protein
VIQQAAKSIGELSNPSFRRPRTKLILLGLRMRMRMLSARGPWGKLRGLNSTLRRLYYDGKGDGDERGKAFRTAREKVVPHLSQEARWLVESDLIVGIPDATAALGADCSGTRGQSRRSVGF